MAIEVELPDGSIVEFPDGTENETMERALRQYSAAPSPRSDFTDVSVTSSSTAKPSRERYAAAGINPDVNATKGESFIENAAAGFGSSYVNLKDSARQLLANNAARHTGALRALQETIGAPGLARQVTASTDDAVRGYQAQVQGEIDQRKRADEDLNRSGGGFTGNALGLLSQLLIPGSALKTAAGGSRVQGANGLAGLASRALMPATVRGSAAQGFALGAAGPVASDESRGVNALLGGAFGAGGAALGRGIGAAARAGKNALGSMFGATTQNALTNQIAQVLRAEAANPGALLSGAPSAVPGVQRTLAEESLDPGIARLERLLRSKGGAWGDVDRANNNARVEALSRFAGDDAAIAAAKRDRGSAAKPLLERALEVIGVDSAPVLKELTALSIKAQGRPAVQDGLSQVSRLLKRVAPDDATKTVPEDRLAVLYNVRKTIDDMLSGKYGGESAAALAGSRELIKVKDAIDDVLVQASPEFGQYLDAFRQASVPIGRMQIGRELLEKGGAVPDAVSGNVVLTPAQFSRASRDLDRVAAKATGFSKAEASRYLTPDDTATIGAIQDDLQRRNFAATAGSGGNSQTFERLTGNDRLSRGVANRVAERIPVFGAAAQYLRETGQQRLESKLAEVLMSPEQARSILASVPADDRRVLEVALTRAGNYIGAVSAQTAE